MKALSVLNATTVLDIGANVGQYAGGLRLAGFEGRIESFEPLPDAFCELDARATRDASWRAHQCAVGIANGTLDINVSANSYSSSALPMAPAHSLSAPESVYIMTVTTNVTALSDIVPDLGLEPGRTFVKVDVQGFEEDVVRGAGAHLSNFAGWQLELSLVELYQGQWLLEDVILFMRESGYSLWALDSGFTDRRSGRMLQCDGIFVPVLRAAEVCGY